MVFILMHQTVARHDAIGNDIEAMFKLLNTNHRCVVFADNCFNDSLTYINESELTALLGNAGNTVLYHHSVYWEKGMQYLENAAARIIFKYHNITPPEFFQPFNAFHESQCGNGRQQTLALQKRFPQALWMCDSNYNATDVVLPAEHIAICPPFHKIEEWASVASPEPAILSSLIGNQTINLLFVGRIVPNKGYLFLLDVLYTYCLNYGTNIKLHMIGKFDSGLKGFNDQINAKIRRLGLESFVHFVGDIDDSILMSYYLGCDFMLCASDHEGFCVPVVEAQYFYLPVIAKSQPAVMETLGDEQLILQGDPREYAAAIRQLLSNKAYYQYLVAQGRRNYGKRFSLEIITKTFTQIINSQCGVEL